MYDRREVTMIYQMRTKRRHKFFSGLLIIALLFVMLHTFSPLTAYGTTDPDVTIVNPLDGSTLYSNSLLISVKLTAPETIRINVYKQMRQGDNETPVAVTFTEWDKYAAELKEIEAGSETVIGPSIKVLNGYVTDTFFFTSTGNLAFFTKKIDNLTVGIYKVKIETIGQNDQIVYTKEHILFVKEKTEQPVQASIFENSQKGTVSFLQNLLRSIFKK